MEFPFDVIRQWSGPVELLTADERDGVERAVRGVFAAWRAKRNGESPGVLSRSISEDIERAIPLAVPTFEKGRGHADLWRAGRDWEVKIAKTTITVNQSAVIGGESYIATLYNEKLFVREIFVIYDAKEEYFGERYAKSNARGLRPDAPREVLF